jgi:AraC-like DNA-binding protein
MLSFYIFLFSAGLFENWLVQNNNSLLSSILLSFLGNSSYLYGPLLYLFVYYLIKDINIPRKKDFLHFIVFFVFFSADCFIILQKIEIGTNTAEVLELLQFELLVAQTLIYNLLAIQKLKGHYNFILQTYSNIEERDLNWLKTFLIIITTIYCLSFLLSHLMLAGVNAASNFFVLVQIAITSCIYLMSYVILSSPHLFTERKIGGLNTLDEQLQEKNGPHLGENGNTGEALPMLEKYKKSGLKLDLASHYLEILKNLMEKEKPFKNPDLNIHLLSTQLGVSKNHLTQIINEQLKMNFYEFINTYRIEEAKNLLLNPAYSHLSLLGIAAESGYKSKATFFSNFKKRTGLTPLEWQKENSKLPKT